MNSHGTPAQPTDLVDAQYVADYLQVPIDTLYGWRYKGVGPPAAKVGRHLRYRLKDLEAWLDQQMAS